MTSKREIRRRPFCPGCGLWYAVWGEHREDCTAKKQQKKGS